MVVTDKEKSEMIKYLLKETQSSKISELCDNVEKETKAIINTKLDSEQLAIGFKTKEFNKILKELRKASPVLNQFCSKLLNELPKNVKALACLLLSSSNNNLYVSVNRKNARLKRYHQRKTERRPKTTNPLDWQIA